jgi:4,5-DOPA dioxygenase extradiol
MGTLTPTIKMPAIFLGHGNPMYAIEQNEFTDSWKQLGTSIAKPQAILVISAHWETNGTYLTAMDKPKTLHDFGGFPRELHEVQYPATGSPSLAAEIAQRLTNIKLDFNQWGLDHGSWSILKHMYPDANTPILQLSLNKQLRMREHYELGSQLAYLREMGVLIIGSGNIVHNLQLINWGNKDAYHDWAKEANDLIKEWTVEGNLENLMDYKNKGKSINLAIPTPEHFIPLIYMLALRNKTDKISFLNDKLLMGSLSMTSILFE